MLCLVAITLGALGLLRMRTTHWLKLYDAFRTQRTTNRCMAHAKPTAVLQLVGNFLQASLGVLRHDIVQNRHMLRLQSWRPASNVV
jgi:hypothetical protein